MPIIKSAIKKMRKDKKRTKLNKSFLIKMKASIRKAKKENKKENIKNAVSFIDKAVKKGILKKNTASRIKSKVTKTVSVPEKKEGKTQVKKTKGKKKTTK